MKIIHKIAHKLGWYSGQVVSKTVKGSVWVGFQCSSCGKVEGWHNADRAINMMIH